MDLLTPFHETKEHSQNYLQPLPKVIDGEEEFEVEEIIDECTYHQKKQYLVKWLGYSASDNSWVNAKDLNAPPTLREILPLKGIVPQL
jgi:hypothetical protein